MAINTAVINPQSSPVIGPRRQVPTITLKAMAASMPYANAAKVVFGPFRSANALDHFGAVFPAFKSSHTVPELLVFCGIHPVPLSKNLLLERIDFEKFG